MSLRYQPGVQSNYSPQPIQYVPSQQGNVYSSQVGTQSQKVVYVQQVPQQPAPVYYIAPPSPVKTVKVEEAPPSPPKRQVIQPKEEYQPPRPKVVAPAEPKSKYSFCRNLLWVLPLILAILALIFSSIIIDRHNNTTGVDDAKSVLDHLKYHLDQHPIEKLAQKAATAASCPDGLNSIDLGEWPGTTAGCLCADGNHYPKYRCYTDKKDCKIVSTESALPIKNWKTKSQFCIKNKDKLDTLKGSSTTCSNPYQTNVCFKHLCCIENPLSKIADSATLLNEVEINSNHRNLKINHNHSGPVAAHDYAVSPTADKVALDTGFKLFSYDTLQQPFIEIRVSNGQDICWNNQLRAQNDGTTFYPLENKLAQGCDDFGKVDTVLIDSIKQTDLYNVENGFDFSTKLPFYNTFVGAENKAYLLAVRRTKICPENNCDEVCRTLKTEQIEQISNTTHNLLRRLRGFAIAILVISAVLVFVAIVYIIVRKAKYGSIGEFESVHFKVLFALAAVIAILSIIFGSYYLYEIHREGGINNQKELIQKILDKQCFADDNLHKAFRRYLDTIVNSENLYHYAILSLFWLSIAFIILSIVAIAIRATEQPKEIFEKPF